jgi:hypothetical protein
MKYISGNGASTFNANYKEKTPWPETTIELNRPSYRSLSARLVPTLADIECHVVSVTDPYGSIFGFLDRSSYFFFQVAPQLYSDVQWALFQTHYFSENVVARGIEPGPLDL